MALLFPSTAAAAADAAGEFLYDSVDINGTITTPAFAGLVFLPPGETPKHASITLHAENLVVNWTERSRVEIADPANWSQPYGGVPKGPPTHGESSHANASADATFSTPMSNLIIVGRGGETPTIEFQVKEAKVKPNPVDQWIGGSRVRGSSTSPDPNGTAIYYPLAAALTQVQAGNGTFEVRGNLTLYVWETTLNVTSQDQRTTYTTGSWTQPAGPLPTADGPVRERHYRLLTLHATGAIIKLQLDSGKALINAAQLHLESTGNARFEAAEGLLRVGDVDRSLLRDELSVTGTFGVSARNQSTSEPRLRGTLTLGPGPATFAVAGQEVASVTAPVEQGRFRWWMIAGAASLLILGVGAARRFQPVRIEQVELALLGGQDRRAGRLAQRLARKRPQDPDALFLYGTTLLQRRDFPQLLSNLEPLALRIAKPERRGLAFLLAVAAHATGDTRTARKWATEASVDPMLADRMRADGIDFAKRSGTQQSGYA